jgi:hypothetical protein
MLILDVPTHKHLLALVGEEASLAFLYPQVVDSPFPSQHLRLSAAQQEAVLDALSTLLLTKGITTGEINALGVMIERLLDIVSQGLYD